MLNALHAHTERHASAEQLARECCEIEMVRCREPIGKQDQYAAAYGGLNYIRFNSDDSVIVEPIICRRETLQRLQESILVFYTGMTRSASKILQDQGAGVIRNKTKQKALLRMVELAEQLKRELQQNHLPAFGEIIHENWELKRRLSDSISNPAIRAGPVIQSKIENRKSKIYGISAPQSAMAEPKNGFFKGWLRWTQRPLPSTGAIGHWKIFRPRCALCGFSRSAVAVLQGSNDRRAAFRLSPSSSLGRAGKFFAAAATAGKSFW